LGQSKKSSRGERTIGNKDGKKQQATEERSHSTRILNISMQIGTLTNEKERKTRASGDRDLSTPSAGKILWIGGHEQTFWKKDHLGEKVRTLERSVNRELDGKHGPYEGPEVEQNGRRGEERGFETRTQGKPEIRLLRGETTASLHKGSGSCREMTERPFRGKEKKRQTGR